MHVGNYIIRLEGKLSDFFMYSFKLMNVSVRCNVKSVVPLQKDFSVEYIAGSPEMHV